MPGARGAGGRESAGRGAGAAAEHRGDAAHQGFVDLLRADEMDVRVEAAGGENLALACDHLGARADDDRHAGLDVRISSLADRRDHAVLDRDVGLHDAPVIEDRRIGYDGVDCPPGARNLALPHAVANDLATAELHLLAVGGEILLDLDEQLRVREPHAIPRGRPEHVGVGGAGERGGGTGVGALGHHGSLASANRNKSVLPALPSKVRVTAQPAARLISPIKASANPRLSAWQRDTAARTARLSTKT